MKSTVDMVKEFHQKFGHPAPGKPNLGNKDLLELRMKLLHEELDEFDEALESAYQYAKDDKPIPAGLMAKVLKEAADIQYVLDGALVSLGIEKYKDAAFLATQESNMSKLGEDGEPIYREDGKILKGPNFFKAEPLIEELFKE